jgi:hypothetical protein
MSPLLVACAILWLVLALMTIARRRASRTQR